MSTTARNAPGSPPGESSLATFEFRRGDMRGSHLSLFSKSLVHRAGDFFEMMPLAQMGSVRAGFERDSSRMNRGGILLVLALLALGAYWPLRSLVGIAFNELNPQSQGGGAFLPAALMAADLCVGLLPVVSGLLALWGISFLVFAWIGNTVLTVATGATERAFATRGRDPELFEFAETVAAHLDMRS